MFWVLQGSKLELIGNKYVAEKLLNLIQVVTARVILGIEGFIYFGIYHSIFVRNSSHRFIRLLVCNWTLRHFRSTQHLTTATIENRFLHCETQTIYHSCYYICTTYTIHHYTGCIKNNAENLQVVFYVLKLLKTQ